MIAGKASYGPQTQPIAMAAAWQRRSGRQAAPARIPGARAGVAGKKAAPVDSPATPFAAYREFKQLWREYRLVLPVDPYGLFSSYVRWRVERELSTRGD